MGITRNLTFNLPANFYYPHYLHDLPTDFCDYRCYIHHDHVLLYCRQNIFYTFIYRPLPATLRPRLLFRKFLNNFSEIAKLAKKFFSDV